MTTSDHSPGPEWSSSVLERVDRVATRFEEQLRAGAQPRIEDCLAEMSGAERAKLLFELLLVELDHLRAKGAEPLPLAHYLQRFSEPGVQDIVRSAYHQVSAAAPEQLQAGDLLLGRYQLLSRLGRGGTGTVWRVRERDSGHEYALKIQPVADPERLRQDYRLAEELRDDHIVTMRNLDLAGGRAYLRMDLIDGPDLQRYLAERGQVPLEEALGIGEQLAQALDKMHGKGMVHRDLKPANVVVARGREHRPGAPFVVLVDLGLLRTTEAPIDGESVTQKGREFAGTPQYMAPEQWTGATLTASVDQWALAVILVQMITGHLPFHGPSYEEVGAQVRSGSPPCPAELSGAQWAALRRGLSKDRHRRYRSCMALIAALRAAPSGPKGRRPRLALSAAATLLCVIALLLGRTAWIRRRPATSDLGAQVAMLLERGDAYAERNQRAQARAAYLEALRLPAEGTIEESDWNRLIDLARKLEAVGGGAELIPALRRMAELYLARGRVLSPEQRFAYAASAAALLQRALLIALHEHRIKEARDLVTRPPEGLSPVVQPIMQGIFYSFTGDREQARATYQRLAGLAATAAPVEQEMTLQLARAGLCRFGEGREAFTGCLGVLVTSVTPGLPADQMGLKAWDVLLRYQDRCLAEREDLLELLQAPRDQLRSLLVFRDGHLLPLKLHGLQSSKLGANVSAF